MRRRQISIGLDAATEPGYRLSVGIELNLGVADIEQPAESVDIARREAKCFVDMEFGLGTATNQILGQADVCISVGQISIERERLLAFFDAVRCAIGCNFDAAKNQVSRSVLRSHG